jgi:hypothetical protein
VGLLRISCPALSCNFIAVNARHQMQLYRCKCAVTARFYRCNTTLEQNQRLLSENAVKHISYSDLQHSHSDLYTYPPHCWLGEVC